MLVGAVLKVAGELQLGDLRRNLKENKHKKTEEEEGADQGHRRQAGK